MVESARPLPGFLSYRWDVIEFTVNKKEARRGYGGLPVEEIMF